MRSSPTLLGFGTAAMAVLTLAGCNTVMKGLVGPSKEQAAAQFAADAPPPPAPPTAAFVTDSNLMPGFAGNAVLPPTLPMDDVHEAGVDEPLPPSSAGPHKAIVSVPLLSDDKGLAALGAAANRDAQGGEATFVLLVLSPAANDAATMDKANTAARDAANRAVTIMGTAGIARASETEKSGSIAAEFSLYRVFAWAVRSDLRATKSGPQIKMVEPRFRPVQP